MAFTSVIDEYSDKGLRHKTIRVNYAANDITGTVLTDFTQVLCANFMAVGTVSPGTVQASLSMLVGTASTSYTGTATGTSAGFLTSTGVVTFDRCGTGTTLAQSYYITLIGK